MLYNYHFIELDHNGTYAIYIAGENQPIQTSLTLDQAKAWIDTKMDSHLTL